MNNQLPFALSIMFTCVEIGCHDVPEPIWPMNMTFDSLPPTRTPISSPDITPKGPMFKFIPGMFSMPFMFPIEPGDGLALGIFITGMFCIELGDGLAPDLGIFIPGIFICGDAPGEAEGMGMFISICFCGDACGLGEAEGICIPGMFIGICCGDDDGDGLFCGMAMPGMFICI